MTPRPCRHCGEPFAGRKALIYCSPKCGALARAAVRCAPISRAHRAPFIPERQAPIPLEYSRPCCECGHVFWSLKKNDPFCSDRCVEVSRGRRDAKRRARWAVKYALQTGRLVRGGCERASGECAGKIEAHHDDHSRPLEVRWLCRHHHLTVDQERAA